MIKRGFVDFACERNRVSVFTLWCIRERERERERGRRDLEINDEDINRTQVEVV